MRDRVVILSRVAARDLAVLIASAYIGVIIGRGVCFLG